MYYVYILTLSDRSIYIGSAADLKRRMTDHKDGHVFSTKKLRPATLRWYCACNRKNEAMKLEKYLKSGSGFAWRKRHLGF